MMFNPINALRTLASHAFDGLSMLTYPAADDIWDSATRRHDVRGSQPSAEADLLGEIAGHLAALRALLEDVRNLMMTPATTSVGGLELHAGAHQRCFALSPAGDRCAEPAGHIGQHALNGNTWL